MKHIKNIPTQTRIMKVMTGKTFVAAFFNVFQFWNFQTYRTHMKLFRTPAYATGTSG